MRPESTMLLACARAQLDAAHRDLIIHSIQRGVDWRLLWARASKHGVPYFVATHARQLADQTPEQTLVPRWLLDQVSEQQRRFMAQALRFLHYQQLLAERFETQGLVVLWIKGLGLAQQLYRRLEARCCSDLDLLARSTDRQAVSSCLRQLGFKPYHSLIPGKDEHPQGAHHDAWVHETDGQIVIEAHYRLSGPASCQPRVDEVIARARWLELAGQPVRVPDLEDELLMLCLHAHQHNFAMLRTLMDIAEYVTVHGAQLDWSQLFDRAQACRASGRVHAALALAEATLGRAIDHPRKSVLTRFQRLVLRRLTPEAIAGAAGDQDDLRRLRLTLLMDRWSDVGRSVLPHFLPPASYVRAICPAPWRRIPGLPRLYHLARLGWRALGG
ncbi:MAG: nucleotidyltransferase family protein [Gemmataceae bacterium]